MAKSSKKKTTKATAATPKFGSPAWRKKYGVGGKSKKKK